MLYDFSDIYIMAIPSPEECRLVIQSYPDDLDERWISSTLSKYGPITGIEIPLRRNGKRKGYVYVQFTNVDHLKACINDINGMRLNNRILGALPFSEFQSRKTKIKNKMYFEEPEDDIKPTEETELEPPAYVKIPRRDVQIVNIPRPKTPPTPPPSPPPKPPPVELIRVGQDSISPIIPPQQPILMPEDTRNERTRPEYENEDLDEERYRRYGREDRDYRSESRERRRERDYERERGRDKDYYSDRDPERRHRRRDRDNDNDRRSHRHSRHHRNYD